ncbi:MAG: hypothetical protein QXF12_01260 [Candidatus Aenigmatarchaeota archaeon]
MIKNFFSDFGYETKNEPLDLVIYDKNNQCEKYKKRYFLWGTLKYTNYSNSEINKYMTNFIFKIKRKALLDLFIFPDYLSVFTNEKVAFLEFHHINKIINKNDINWNSRLDHAASRDYIYVLESINDKIVVFDLINDYVLLQNFINKNFKKSEKIVINKNNVFSVYGFWYKEVQHSISIDWKLANEVGLQNKDFFIADLIYYGAQHKDKKTTTDLNNIEVIFDGSFYTTQKSLYRDSLFDLSIFGFKDKRESHDKFWSNYEIDYDVINYAFSNSDIFVDFDKRAKTGSFYTPLVWVEKAHEYLSQVLGKNWQDEYYVWDCAAGTGNLLVGLKNPDRVFASTLEQEDIEIMLNRKELKIKHENVFQFDFINDKLKPKSKGGKVPDHLYSIITNPEKRQNLLFIINPPYGSVGNLRVIAQKEVRNKIGFKNIVKVNKPYYEIRSVKEEMFLLFIARIYYEIPDCYIALFSRAGFLIYKKYQPFMHFFRAKFLKGFCVPSYTFENVVAHFPLIFSIWSTKEKRCEKSDPDNNYLFDIYDKENRYLGVKQFIHIKDRKLIHKWITNYNSYDNNSIAFLSYKNSDFLHQRQTFITNNTNLHPARKVIYINETNLFITMVYLSVRQAIPESWLNQNDLFYEPDIEFMQDYEFITDCLYYALFHKQNVVSIKHGVNHLIPFREEEVGAKQRYDSHRLIDFIEKNKEKIIVSKETENFVQIIKEIYRYYHSKENTSQNASFHDIKEYFKKRSENNFMKNKSSDPVFNKLYEEQQKANKVLTAKIENKIYEYSFLVRTVHYKN